MGIRMIGLKYETAKEKATRESIEDKYSIGLGTLTKWLAIHEGDKEPLFYHGPVVKRKYA